MSVAVARGRGGAVAGQVVVGVAVQEQPVQVGQAALATQLQREQRLQLKLLDGAQEDHGVFRRKWMEIGQGDVARILILLELLIQLVFILF